MRIFRFLLCAALCLCCCAPALAQDAAAPATLLYQGHASLRITCGGGQVIYVDPYQGNGYDVPADLILVTHGHSDHNQVTKVKNKKDDCRIISQTDALKGGEYQTFSLGYVTVQAVQAGNNRNHSLSSCVGYILTFEDGKSVYISGDTSTTEQMATMAEMNLDYAFFCCDGTYNMDLNEAAACARLVAAKHTIPYHFGTSAAKLSAEDIAALGVDGLMVLAPGDELRLE